MKWTQDKVDILKKYYHDTPIAYISLRLGCSVYAAKSKAKQLGLRKYAPIWTEEESRRLIEVYPNHTMPQLLKMFKPHSVGGINKHAQKLGLHKSPEHMAAMGRIVSQNPRSISKRFCKGNIPANKGKHLSDFASSEAIEKMSKGWFVKGRIPHNAKPNGYESIRQGIIYIKTPEHSRMVAKHRYLWQQKYGEIPANTCIVFRDGNSMNCTIDNLMAIRRDEHIRRNIANMSPEQRRKQYTKLQQTRNAIIRRDRIRIHFGMEPKSKLVKHW